MNTIEKQTDLLERSRDSLLNFGYELVVFRSKVKKYLRVRGIANYRF